MFISLAGWTMFRQFPNISLSFCNSEYWSCFRLLIRVCSWMLLLNYGLLTRWTLFLILSVFWAWWKGSRGKASWVSSWWLAAAHWPTQTNLRFQFLPCNYLTDQLLVDLEVERGQLGKWEYFLEEHFALVIQCDILCCEGQTRDSLGVVV